MPALDQITIPLNIGVDSGHIQAHGTVAIIHLGR